MAKVLNELPEGMALNRARQGSGAVGGTSTKAPSGPPKAQRGPKATSTLDKAPKALRRPSRGPGGFINSQEGHEMLMRRCEQFGFAASAYFKGRHTAGTGKIET